MDNNVIIIDKTELDRNFNFMSILLAEAYIDRNKMPKVSELVAASGNEYHEGQVYGAHIQALQKMLIEEFKIMGLDLNTEIEKHGEKFEIGKFSNYENNIILNKLESLGYFANKLIEYKEKNKKYSKKE